MPWPRCRSFSGPPRASSPRSTRRYPLCTSRGPGEATAAHAEAHRSWKHGAALMQEALNRLHAAGDTAHSNYTSVMTNNQNMWS